LRVALKLISFTRLFLLVFILFVISIRAVDFSKSLFIVVLKKIFFDSFI